MTKRLIAEFIGTFFLLATVVGSGIMGDTLSGGNVAIALLGNTIATGAILVVLILLFGPISGAHFNPAVTVSFLIRKEISPVEAAVYMLIQVIAGVSGVLAAHVMFDQPVMQLSETARSGGGQWFAEMIATFGLVMTILGCVRYRPDAVAYGVGLFITAGYWFTASTSFANPAVTIARAFTDTFSGIYLPHVPAFIAAQITGAVLATLIMGHLTKEDQAGTGDHGS